MGGLWGQGGDFGVKRGNIGVKNRTFGDNSKLGCFKVKLKAFWGQNWAFWGLNSGVFGWQWVGFGVGEDLGLQRGNIGVKNRTFGTIQNWGVSRPN